MLESESLEGCMDAMAVYRRSGLAALRTELPAEARRALSLSSDLTETTSDLCMLTQTHWKIQSSQSAPTLHPHPTTCEHAVSKMSP